MKPTELMIGDWVVYDGDTEYTNPIQIEGMDIAADSLITSDREDVGFDGVQPIPLTEELLTRNFPDPSEIVWFPLDEYNGFFNIYWEHPSFGEGEVRLNIQYVHQLQHVLRLCGIEKKVEL